jgi:hypothetical protein
MAPRQNKTTIPRTRRTDRSGRPIRQVRFQHQPTVARRQQGTAEFFHSRESSTHAATPFAAGPATLPDGPKLFRNRRTSRQDWRRQPPLRITRRHAPNKPQVVPRTETSDHRRFHSHSSEQTGSTERTTGASTDIKTGVHFSTTTSEPCRDLRHWTPRRTPQHKRMGHASKLTTAPTDHIRNRLPPSIRLRASRCLISPGTWSALTMLHVLSANRWLHETRLATRGRISD